MQVGEIAPLNNSALYTVRQPARRSRSADDAGKKYSNVDDEDDRAVACIAACPHRETHEKENLKELSAEQGWEQINDVGELLESVDAMRKPKSRSSATKFNSKLENRHSRKEEFQLSLTKMAEEQTWRNDNIVQLPGMSQK